MRRVGFRELAAKGAIVATLLACIATTDPSEVWLKTADGELGPIVLTTTAPESTVHFRVESSRPPFVTVSDSHSFAKETGLSATLTIEDGNDLTGFQTGWSVASAEGDDGFLRLEHSAGPGGFDSPSIQRWGPGYTTDLRPDCYPCVNRYSLVVRFAPGADAPASITLRPHVEANIAGESRSDGREPPRAYVRVEAE
jgi:hypothetical protein